MRALRLLSLFCLLSGALAQQIQAPFGRPNIPVSPADRVYAANQTSNTVSVIEPYTNKLLGVIRLGNPVPGALSPLYRDQLLTHGMGYSPDDKTVDVVNIASNSVTLIDTTTNAVKGTIYLGRSPHEAFFTPDGRELWVTVRGENYVSVIDPVRMKEIRRITVDDGPGMTMFTTDGKYAFVCSSFTPQLAVIDAASHRVVKEVAQVSPFCPNIAVSPENDEVWFTLKDSAKTQVISAQPPFELKAVLETGSITNHVNFVNNANGKFAYVTIGGLNQIKVYRRGATPQLVATIPVGSLPHGIWPSGDGTRVYVVLENETEAIAVDTLTNKVIAHIPIGQTSQAVVYVPNAVTSGDGTSNLMPLGVAEQVATLHLEAASTALPYAQASVAVNSLGLLDLVQIAAVGLAPNKQYEVFLADHDQAPFGTLLALASFKTYPEGGQIVQTIGPLKSLASGSSATSPIPQRFLIVTEYHDPSHVVLRQTGY